MSEEIKQEPTSPTFASLHEVKEHLKAAGYRISKSKIYRDRDDGKIVVNEDGTVSELSVRAYAAEHLAQIGPSVDDLNNIQAMKAESKLMAWYECEHCQAKWDDETRNRAVRAGEWRSRGQFPMTVSAYMKNYGPKKVGFHLPAWVSFFVSLSESAAAFIRGQRDRVKLRDFANNYAAEPWKSVVVTTEFEDILSCRTELKPMTVPQRAVALTCGIDVQKHGFWFVVRAWARDYTSWLIDYGYLFTWEDVDKLLWKKRYPVDGMQFEAPIWRAAIDTGGGQYNTLMSSTEETYLWLQSRLGMGGCKAFGVKGASRPLPKKVRIGEPLSRTPSGVPLKAGMRHIQIDTGQLKSLFHERLELAVDQLPGGAYLNADVKEDYVKQILSEQKVVDEKGVERWELKKGKANHLLDCEVMASVVADWEWSGHGVEQFREPEVRHDEGKSECK